MTYHRNIVIVGASVGGHNLANALSATLPTTHRIILIERSEFVIHAPTVVRALVVPGWEEKHLTARITQETVFTAESRHRVHTTNVLELREDSVILENEQKCILATGAHQPSPVHPVYGTSLEEYKVHLRHSQEGIVAASSMVIVGGGTVGVEVAGEISSAYPEKQVTIVHANPAGLLHPGDRYRGPKVVDPRIYTPNPTPPYLSKTLEAQLATRGVEIILGDRVVSSSPLATGPLPAGTSLLLASGQVLEADYVFLSTGNIPNSSLVASADPKALTPSGHIAVDQYFRILPSDFNSIFAGAYYAIGDVASAPAWKTLASAQEEGIALANNIIAEIRGRNPTPYAPGWTTNSVAVTLGTRGGAGTLALPVVGDVCMPGGLLCLKSRDFFAGKSFFNRFRGPEKVTTCTWSCT